MALEAGAEAAAVRYAPSPNIFASGRVPLFSDADAARRVAASTVSLSALLGGSVPAAAIEAAAGDGGCGAVLVRLDDDEAAHLYDDFYRALERDGYAALLAAAAEGAAAADAAATEGAARDEAVVNLLLAAGIAVVRARLGVAGPAAPPDAALAARLANGVSLPLAIGRIVRVQRKDFHPPVAWLEAHAAEITAADENGAAPLAARLLELARAAAEADAAVRVGDGGLRNFEAYYGAFRGPLHVDRGATVTVLFGPGEVRALDGGGLPAPRAAGGTLLVRPPTGAPNGAPFVELPRRLDRAPFVVVFFHGPDAAAAAVAAGGGAPYAPIVVTPRGPLFAPWPSTPHGVARVDCARASRGQAALFITFTNAAIGELAQ